MFRDHGYKLRKEFKKERQVYRLLKAFIILAVTASLFFAVKAVAAATKPLHVKPVAKKKRRRVNTRPLIRFVLPEQKHVAIERYERGKKKKHSMRFRNNRINNPFNIRSSKAKWLGQTSSEKGFCVFSSMTYGIRAGMKLLADAYYDKGFTTVTKIISRYAPASENNTKKYITYICTRMGLGPNEIIVPTKDTFALLGMAITEQENGRPEGRTLDEIRNVLVKFGYNIKVTATIN